MTCIVGHIDKKNDRVIIAGDSAGVSNLDITIRKDVKVFKVGDFVIGCTSSFRMIQVIRFSFSPPHYDVTTDLFKYMCTDFIDQLRSTFKRCGFASKENEVESGGTFLIGFKSRLFKIYDDYQVSESVDGYDACGCGEDYAKGALMAMLDKIDIRSKLKKSLEIATYFSGGVRPPYVIETT